MSLMLVGVGLVIELKTDRGLSPTFASFLGAVLATFSAANFGCSRDHMKSRSGNGNVDGLTDKIEQLHNLALKANDAESIAKLIELFTRVDQGVSEVKAVTSQVGHATLSLGQKIDSMRTRNG